MQKQIEYTSESAEQTQELAALLGRSLDGGECLAFFGELGTGKTCFVQGLARGLDVPDSVYVRSPTFTLVDVYPGRLSIYHMDLYRLSDIDELEAIGWRDGLLPDSVMAIEWAERLDGFLPENTISISISHLDENTRQFCFACGQGLPNLFLKGLSSL